MPKLQFLIWSTVCALGRNFAEEGEDAAAKFHRLKAEGRGVKRAGDDPELPGAAGGGVNHFRMAAGQGDILFITNQENGKRAGGDGLLRRDFRDWKARQLFVAVKQRPGEWREKSFAQPGRFSQTGVVVSSFAKVGEGSLRGDGFDARVGGRGLQHDSRAHGF